MQVSEYFWSHWKLIFISLTVDNCVGILKDIGNISLQFL